MTYLIPNYLRNRDLPSYQSKDEENPYAMIFVVNDSKDENGQLPAESDILTAATNAFILLLASDNEEVVERVEAWVSGRIRKIVKRAKNAAWDKLDAVEVPSFISGSHEAQVKVFAPMRIHDQPSELRKLQVTGLQATDVEPAAVVGKNFLEVFVDKKLNMSTGKLVAQVNHAVQLFLMSASDDRVDEWLMAGHFLRVIALEAMPEASEVDVVVHDAGFTEVPAGSLTATARLAYTSPE
jgi:peptidyl-tRNA hydrolase